TSLFVVLVVHRLLEAFDGPAQVRADRLQTLGAENQQRNRQDDQKFFETDAHSSLPPSQSRRIIRQALLAAKKLPARRSSAKPACSRRTLRFGPRPVSHVPGQLDNRTIYALHPVVRPY